MPTLVVKYQDGSLSHPLEEGAPVFIGRAPECDIQLPSPAVSRKHAVIIYKNGICGIKDLESFNGTLVNDNLITKPHHLTDSDVVKISSFTLRLRNVGDEMPLRIKPTGGGLSAGRTVNLSQADQNEATVIAPPIPGTRSAAESFGTIRARSSATKSILPGAPADASAEHGGAMGDASETCIDDASSEATIELSEPAAYAANLAATAQDALEAMLPPSPARRDPDVTPTDTDYFRTPEPEDSMNFAADTVSEFMASAVSPSEAPVRKDSVAVGPVDGEKVIPLEESPPTLTLGEDEATTVALEALVANLPGENEAFFPPLDADGEPGGPLPVMEDLALAKDSEESERERGGTSLRAAWPGDDYDPIPESAYDDWLTEADEDRGAGLASDFAAVRGGNAIVLSPALLEAVSNRLSLYSQLADLSEERRLYRMGNPDLPPEVSAELKRQDDEVDNPPFSDEAERQILALKTRHEQFDEDMEAASMTGSIPERPEIRGAEQMAIAQWRLILEYNEEALPAVFKEAYRLAVDEELTRELAAARINHGRLMGGAMYLLALEALAGSARTERKNISGRLRPAVPREKPKGILGKIGQLIRQGSETVPAPDPQAKTREAPLPRFKPAILAREFSYIEKSLIRDFNQVYRHAAVHFIGSHQESMPPAVRAFLRYGVISLKPSWVSEEAREFILRDCAENVLPSFEVGPELTNILYADEYLAAVANMECASFPDDNLGGHEKSAIERKADRAYRRIVNSRTYNILMEDMLQGLDTRLRELTAQEAESDRLVAEAESRHFIAREKLVELQNEQQIVSIRRTNLDNNIKRIEKEVVASILESVEEAEGRFRRGELRMPGARSLLWREAASLADLSRRMAGASQRFPPLAVREHFTPGAEPVNDRDALRAGVEDIERLDPGLFISLIMPAKKKINRITLRLSPVMVILPGAGLRGICAMGRDGMETGHLAVPLCFAREEIRNRQLACLMADYRWLTSLNTAGRDIMSSDTLAGAFTKLRWEWRNEPKAKREKALIISELTDEKNWRRIYELYLSDASSGARQLFLRNPKCYTALIDKHIDLPAGVDALR